MKKSVYVPFGIATVIFLVWFLVPSAPFCSVFKVEAINCNSWSSGLFGVGLGGVLTLWASWYFGDKSSAEIVSSVEGKIQTRLDAVAVALEKRLDAQFKHTAERVSQVPGDTADILQARTATVAVFAAAPYLARGIPKLVELVSSLSKAPPKQEPPQTPPADPPINS